MATGKLWQLERDQVAVAQERRELQGELSRMALASRELLPPAIVPVAQEEGCRQGLNSCPR